MFKNSVRKYWTKHNVTDHYIFQSMEDSVDYLNWRNSCYLYYADLMSTKNADNLTVLDYGCGPGHDLVGFAKNSAPKRLIGMDVSNTSIREAKERMKLHNQECIFFNPSDFKFGHIPLDDDSVDLINCSGVIHHIGNPKPILDSFKRILKPDGRMQVMVYNYDSIWVHLYAAYELLINDGSIKNHYLRKFNLKKKHTTLEEAFRVSTDGKNCPISRFYKKDEFIKLLERSGLNALFKGSSISLNMEMSRLEKRFQAITDRRLPKVHREFLNSLTFDSNGAPLFKGHTAGIGACFEATIN